MSGNLELFRGFVLANAILWCVASVFCAETQKKKPDFFVAA
jgi:hypothetical protein